MKRTLAALAVSFTLVVGLSACQSNAPNPEATGAPGTSAGGGPPASAGGPAKAAGDPHAEGTAPAAGGAPFAGGGQAPFAGGGGDEKDPDVDKLVAAAEKQEKALKSEPSDADKKKVGEAFYQAGHTMMMSPKLGFKTKYRGALKLFRVALKYDPKHAQAAEEKKTIEDIYKSMGRPVPE